MAAGLAMVKYLRDTPSTYQLIEQSTTSIVDGIRRQMHEKGMNFTVNQVGSMFTLFFTDKVVADFETATTSDTKLFATFFQSMLKQGIYIAPSQYEAMFISTAIDSTAIERILDASAKAIDSL